MKKMLMVLTAGLIVAAQPPEAKQQDDAKKELQGTWDVTSLEILGQKPSAEDLKQLEMKIIFKDDKVTLKSKKGDEEMTYKLDPAKMPRTIDATDKDKKLEKGIYEVHGDVLKLCIAKEGTERPTEFASKSDPKTPTILVTAKRAI